MLVFSSFIHDYIMKIYALPNVIYLNYQVNGQNWYKCDFCPKVRSPSISTLITHVCMKHTLEQISEKIIAEKYHRIT